MNNTRTKLLGPEAPSIIPLHIIKRIQDLEDIMNTCYATTLDDLTLRMCNEEYERLADKVDAILGY